MKKFRPYTLLCVITLCLLTGCAQRKPLQLSEDELAGQDWDSHIATMRLCVESRLISVMPLKCNFSAKMLAYKIVDVYGKSFHLRDKGKSFTIDEQIRLVEGAINKSLTDAYEVLVALTFLRGFTRDLPDVDVKIHN